MQTFTSGDNVRLVGDFGKEFPDTYTVLGFALSGANNTYLIDIRNDGIGSDFHVIFLEAV